MLRTVRKADLNPESLTSIVRDRLKEENLDKDMVITDAMGCMLSKTATREDLGAPGNRFLVAELQNFDI